METIQDTHNSEAFSQAAETEGHVTVSNSVSFEELESLQASDKVEAELEAKKEASKDQIKEELNDDASKKAKPKKKEAKGKGESKEVEAKKNKKEASKDGDETESTPDDTKETKSKAKTYKYKLDDKDFEISGETKFEVKVDGQKEEASFQDLINNYSGLKAADRRFSELNEERKVFLEEKAVIDQTVNDLTDHIANGKPEKALISFFSALGANPAEVMGVLREQFRKEAEKMAGMSEEERGAYEANLSAQHYKELYETRIKRDESEAEDRRLNSEIAELQEKHSIDDNTFNDVAEELLEMQAKGQLSQRVTPEMIVRVAVQDRITQDSIEMLNAYGEDAAKSKDDVKKVVAMKQAGMSDEEITVILKSKYGEETTNSSAQVLSDKIRKNNSTRASQESRSPQHEEIWDFGQI